MQRSTLRCAHSLLSLMAATALVNVRASPYDPLAFGSCGTNPFGAPGNYMLNTTTPGFSGPGGACTFAFVTPENVVVFTFDSISVAPGAIVRAVGTRPAALLSRSTFEVQAGALIDVSGSFVAGTGYVTGAGGSFGGFGPGAGGAAASGGGGGFGTNGGAGGGTPGGVGGTAYGNLLNVLQGGSGGGNFGSDGGPSGGVIELGAATSLSIAGSVRADGYFAVGGAGGGSGGGLLIHAPTVSVSGVVSASGGDGGAGGAAPGGGGGGAGRINFLTANGTMTVVPGAVIAALGGNGGTGSPAGQGANLLTPVVGPFPSPPPPPRAPAAEGCVKMSGAPLVGAIVRFKQKGMGDATTTDGNGCYAFTSGQSGRTGTITIELPTLP
jgi:hypothetical protein